MTFETKYVAPPGRARALLERLQRGFPADGEFPENRVHSVYFDTPSLDAMAEVDNGDFRKEKVRVRWYEDGSLASPVFLECKRKEGVRRAKERILLDDFDPRVPLHHPKWLSIPSLLREKDGLPRSGLLEPVLHVTYRRHRFTEPSSGLRLSLDHEIRAARVHPRRAAAAPLSSRPSPLSVFEIKGKRRDLPSCLRFVRELGARRRAFSKYGLWIDLFR
ncbi:MAG: hypothetical protein Fur0037_15350 [Planctomycetota bacterium]